MLFSGSPLGLSAPTTKNPDFAEVVNVIVPSKSTGASPVQDPGVISFPDEVAISFRFESSREIGNCPSNIQPDGTLPLTTRGEATFVLRAGVVICGSFVLVEVGVDVGVVERDGLFIEYCCFTRKKAKIPRTAIIMTIKIGEKPLFLFIHLLYHD